jgi:phosphoribosyl-ATP pyrophosphohydrolase/phosphoribosyl-AMP cyclohydrolase
MTLDDVRFNADGLVPAIVQDARTLQVLTLAYMNEESLRRTVETGETWFWSRSRAELWHKGETSGHTQRVVSINLDCDRDALNILVVPKGPACHKGTESCFSDVIFAVSLAEPGSALQAEPGLPAGLRDQGTSLGEVLESLYSLIGTRKLERPEGSYTTYLFDKGLDKILKKVGEEASETIIAAKNEDPEALTRETADLLYHLCVLLIERDVSLNDVANELLSRRK